MSAETYNDSVVDVLGAAHQESLHIYAIPSGEYTFNEHILLRVFPAEHHLIPDPTPAEAEQIIEDANMHFQALRDCSIEVSNVLFAQETPEAETTRILSIVERVEGKDFGSYWLWPKLGDRAPHQDEALRLAQGCTDYFKWVIETGQPTFLGDIAEPFQSLITGPGRVELMDRDPLFYETFPDFPTQHDLDVKLNTLSRWAGLIQRPEAVADLQKEISSLQEQYRIAKHDSDTAKLLGQYASLVETADAPVIARQNDNKYNAA